MDANPPPNNRVRRAVARLIDATDRMLLAAREVGQARAALNRAAARIELHVLYDDEAENGEGGHSAD
jgi:hypothetical protein